MPEEEVHEGRHAECRLLGLLQFGAESGEALLTICTAVGEPPECQEDFGLFGLHKDPEPIHPATSYERPVEAHAVVGCEADDGALRRGHVTIQEVEEAAARDADAIFIP